MKHVTCGSHCAGVWQVTNMLNGSPAFEYVAKYVYNLQTGPYAHRLLQARQHTATHRRPSAPLGINRRASTPLNNKYIRRANTPIIRAKQQMNSTHAPAHKPFNTCYQLPDFYRNATDAATHACHTPMQAKCIPLPMALRLSKGSTNSPLKPYTLANLAVTGNTMAAKHCLTVSQRPCAGSHINFQLRFKVGKRCTHELLQPERGKTGPDQLKKPPSGLSPIPQAKSSSEAATVPVLSNHLHS